jgi:glycosyltransferase involved in cell wall biosynthesis
MKNAMRDHGLPGNFSNLPNAANTEVFHFTGKNKEADAPFHFLHVSMLVDREKNITGLLTAFAAALKVRPMQLTIIGDGPERKTHEETARKLKIENAVSFVGIKNPAEIAEYMNTHDALVMFSHFEGMPVTIIEAQCCGMPVLATNTGAIREMLTNAKDIIVAPGNTDQMSKAMLVMTDSMHEEKDVKELRRAISEKACAHYSYETVGAKLNSIYRDVLSKP